jgi:sigma-B regulation protein RsbU (phosphoserine phosphatase)
MIALQTLTSDIAGRLSDLEARAQLIVEMAPDAFVGVDLNSRIVDWNRQAANIFGWSRAEVLGLTLWDTIIPNAFHEAHREGMERFRSTGQSPLLNRRIEMLARHKSGRQFPVEITISGPIQGIEGEFFGAFLRDISTRKRREEELRQAKEAAESQTKTLKILNGISRELSTLLDADALLEKIGKLLFQLVEYSTFSVLLLDDSRQNLIHRYAVSGSVLAQQRDISIAEGLAGLAVRTGEPVVANEVFADPHYVEFQPETRSECVVPLIVKDQMIGVLDIENSESNYFRDHHVQAIKILAAQIAIALDNAMLYERVMRQERRLNQDLQFARRIQRLMLPRDLPAPANASVATLSWPARIIAGDLFDFAHYKQRQMHAGILGDVAGKGAPAALYAALTTGLIRNLLENELQPGELLSTLNEALLERPIDAQFVALMFMLWDDVNRTLHVANSGLPKPLHFDGKNVMQIDSVGTPLGLLEGIVYEETAIGAAVGDVFVFLTDGILEACDLEGKEFGYNGLEKVLLRHGQNSAVEIRDAIAHSLAVHTAKADVADDQTLIVLKVEPRRGSSVRSLNLRVRTGELSLM